MQLHLKWRASLCKEIKQHKGELRIQSRAEVGSASNPKSFLNSSKIKEGIRLARKLYLSVIAHLLTGVVRFLLYLMTTS